MTDKNYNELLRKRVLQENKEFNEELEKLPANEALSRAYEKVIKEDLVCSISEGNLTNTEAIFIGLRVPVCLTISVALK